MFAVWEPILPTDWGKPGSGALHRLADPRVRQFWDPDHLVAGVLKRAEQDGGLHKQCCERKGVLWDLAAAYAPGMHWSKDLPHPVLYDGPIVRHKAELGAAVGQGR